MTVQTTPPADDTAQSGRAGERLLLGLGFGVLILCGAILFVSQEFIYARWAGLTPHIWQYIALAMTLGGVLLGLMIAIPRSADTCRALLIIFIVGLAARGMMFFSKPVLEDDWHRYLWDGATVSQGVDPYKYAPAAATTVTLLGEELDWSEDPQLRRLQELVEEDPVVYFRINYPFFKTIYPPIAQAGFGAAYLIAPFDLNGWRTVLLVVDLISFGLIVWTLGLFGRSRLWTGLYWWNPVVLLEVFNAGHMDGLIVPFLVGALALARLNRFSAAVLALAGAAAVKFWPILLAPVLVRKYMFDFKRLIPLALLFSATALLLLWPQVRYVFTDPDQGLVAYSEAWRRHAFLYSVLVEGPFTLFGDPVRAARNLVAVSVGLGALWMAYINRRNDEISATAMLSTVALLLFLSPTGYPWYQVWLAGLIPFAPRYGYIALTIMAPIYYSRFVFGDENLLYQWVLVPIAFGLPLLMLLVPEHFYRRLRFVHTD